MNRILDLPLFLRVIVCALALSAIVVGFANKTVPHVSLLIVFAWVIIAITVIGLVLIGYFVIVAGWNTWSLDHGTTDAQWLWFEDEPPGLQALRAQNENDGDSAAAS